MRKLKGEEANRAIEALFDLPEGSLDSFILITSDNDGGDIWSNMCCDGHIMKALRQCHQAVAATAIANPN